MQCFSHEDECFAPVTKCKRSPAVLVQDDLTLIIGVADNELLSSPAVLVLDDLTLIIGVADNELLSSPSVLVLDDLTLIIGVADNELLSSPAVLVQDNLTEIVVASGIHTAKAAHLNWSRMITRRLLSPPGYILQKQPI